VDSEEEAVMRQQGGWVAVYLCAVCMIGCSKQTNADEGTSAATGGKSGAAGKVGAAGAKATAGAGMVAGTGGMPAQQNPWSVPCGSVTCNDDYMVGMVCCADMAKGTCGVMDGTCKPRATPNPKCPGVTFPVTVPGCCLTDGTTCGVDGYPVMPRCVTLDNLEQYMIPPPDATHCDGTPIGGMAGAGGGKAGTGASGAGGAGGSR
jgi:hypothetical protein